MAAWEWQSSTTKEVMPFLVRPNWEQPGDGQ